MLENASQKLFVMTVTFVMIKNKVETNDKPCEMLKKMKR